MSLDIGIIVMGIVVTSMIFLEDIRLTPSHTEITILTDRIITMMTRTVITKKSTDRVILDGQTWDTLKVAKKVVGVDIVDKSLNALMLRKSRESFSAFSFVGLDTVLILPLVIFV